MVHIFYCIIFKAYSLNTICLFLIFILKENNMKIKINDKEIELKITMRAMIIFEKIADKPFNPITVTDLILYFYATILACCPDFDMTFDYFLSYLDDNPSLFKQFTDFINSENEKQNQLNNKSDNLKKKTAKK